MYTKVPHRPADLNRPYKLRREETVLDLAVLVHKEVAGSLRHARRWGRDGAESQQVEREYPIADEDARELHSRPQGRSARRHQQNWPLSVRGRPKPPTRPGRYTTTRSGAPDPGTPPAAAGP